MEPFMSDPYAPLKNFPKKHDYLVCIDSDGCAFDTMEIKHKECFIPNIINSWGLQAVSKYTRFAAEFVNLYSKDRGINRWPALIGVFDLLNDWPDVQRRGAKIPAAQPVRDWIKRETKLSNVTLKAEIAASNDPVMVQALDWSEAVNKSIEVMVHDVPPFPFVRESLQKITQWADVLVCSATPNEALIREWEEHDIAKYTGLIAGQEMGSKKEHIEIVSAGRYEKNRVIMIGDAPGDLKAARANKVPFFPINPGAEDGSWETFFNEAADQFREGQYTAEYEAKLIAEFDKLLPELPWWKTQHAAKA
jgi:phosphoglycolate phosphatase-like HAD superfamily hydrolase